MDAACRWAFGTLPVDRIELCHAVENVASGRVAEKAGFTYEGHLRRSYRYGDGRKHDELLWARLADDPAPDDQQPGSYRAPCASRAGSSPRSPPSRRGPAPAGRPS